MITVEREVDRFLTLLRNKIREKGFTQLEVQEALGWGRSYISQLLTKQKALRFEQVLLILNVIGSDPRDFLAELYPEALPPSTRFQPQPRMRREGSPQGEVSEIRALLQALIDLLLEKGIIDAERLSAEARTERAKPDY